MYTLERGNVVKMTDSKEKAALLQEEGYQLKESRKEKMGTEKMSTSLESEVKAEEETEHGAGAITQDDSGGDALAASTDGSAGGSGKNAKKSR